MSNIRSDYHYLQSELRRSWNESDLVGVDQARADFRSTLICCCVTGDFEWRSADHERLYKYFEGYA